jgi:CRISPR/Cas system-associated exonuclease Cas4 (RecB family)
VRRGPLSLEDDEVSKEKERFDAPDAAEFGRQVHAILANGAANGALPEALELASRFQSSELGQRAAHACRIEKEFDFVMAIDDIVLRGQIDLWFEEAGEFVLVDYKTDDVDTETALEYGQAYALQLRLYALALERLVGRLPDRAYVYFLRPDRAVPVTLDAPSLESALKTVETFREAQSGLKFEQREAEHCLRCTFYRGLCPSSWRQSAITGERPFSFPAPS